MILPWNRTERDTEVNVILVEERLLSKYGVLGFLHMWDQVWGSIRFRAEGQTDYETDTGT